MIKEFHTPTAALQSGAFVQLGICPRHGSPAVRNRKSRFTSKTPDWVLLIVILSLLIGLIVAVALQKKAFGLMPECERCVKDHGAWKRNTWIAWVGMLALFVLSGVASNAYLLLAGLAVMLVAIVYSMLRTRYEQAGTLSNDAHWLTLRKVDDRFAALASERMAAAAAPAPPA